MPPLRPPLLQERGGPFGQVLQRQQLFLVDPLRLGERLVLADGRTALASPGHPTFDGRPIASLRAGDRFEGSRVASANLLPYRATFTYDLLPSGPTGAYFVNGVLLGSTLAAARPAALRSVRAR